MWNFIRRRSKRCCECGGPERPLIKLYQWCDHNDAGWVCMACAEKHGYLEYMKVG